jgi:hypothetical protein
MGFGQLNEVNLPPEPGASTAMQSAIDNRTSIKKTLSLQISLNAGWHMNSVIAVFQGSGAAITTAYRTFFNRQHDMDDEIPTAFRHLIF